MKLLVACTECRRQFDASGIAAGSRFHCTCGQIVSVPVARGHDAKVVRCSSCGGPRAGTASVCGYCEAGFTLHDQDLQVVCAHCMARVSTRARFCHHCGVPVAPEGHAGQPTRHPCPICAPRRFLNSRRLGKQDLAVLECSSCAGLWLGHDAFEILADRVRDHALPEDLAGAGNLTPGQQTGPMYRKCPHCLKVMNRSNFARQSGVIIDRCKDHGFWFDSGELDAVLRWIKKGGEERALRRQAQAEADAERQTRLKNWRETAGASQLQASTRIRNESGTGGFLELLSIAFDL